MSGHSKWSTIKHKKGAADAKRGKIFTKLVKEISVAVKEGNSNDPTSNPRLRLAIQNAKSYNMPKENIERAIKKTQEKGEEYVQMTYEGHAPHGVALFVECSSNNARRTLSNVKSVFTKYGGSLGKNDSLNHIFDHKGVFIVELPEGADEEEVTFSLIDSGLENLEALDEPNIFEIVCQMQDFGSMQSAIEAQNINIQEAKLIRVPKITQPLSKQAFGTVMKMIEKLEDDDDVQNVYHDMEIPEEAED